jgi:hypothetical protein
MTDKKEEKTKIIEVQFWEEQVMWNLRQATIEVPITTSKQEIYNMDVNDIESHIENWGDVVDSEYGDVSSIDDLQIIDGEFDD